MNRNEFKRTQPVSLQSLKVVAPLLSIVYLTGCQHTFTQLEIDAPPTTVWEIVSETSSYGEWNPYHQSVAGQLEVGQTLEIEIHKPNGNQLTIHPHVMKLEPNRELVWGGGITGIFKGEHSFRIKPVADNKCQLIQEEWFRGLVVPFAELGSIEEGYNAVNQAIKKRAESRYANRQKEG